MAEKQLKALWVKVHGRVQGVGFRFFTLNQAKKLALTGYVRNMIDGTVEVVAEGDEDNLKILLKLLKKGPPASYVTNVETKYITVTGNYNRFNLEY